MSHKIFVFGKTVGYPFGSELQKQQEFIAPQIHPFIKNGINLKILKCGNSHTILITNENNIIWFGHMYEIKKTATIEEIKWKFNEIVDVRSGEACNLFLTSSGSVFGWGSKRYGTLGFEKHKVII